MEKVLDRDETGVVLGRPRTPGRASAHHHRVLPLQIECHTLRAWCGLRQHQKMEMWYKYINYVATKQQLFHRRIMTTPCHGAAPCSGGVARALHQPYFPRVRPALACRANLTGGRLTTHRLRAAPRVVGGGLPRPQATVFDGVLANKHKAPAFAGAFGSSLRRGYCRFELDL